MAPGPSKRIACITGRYPGITHTFILREVRALRRLGVEVRCFSIWRTSERDLLSELDREEWHNTEALLPPAPGRLLRSHLQALIRAPRAYAATITRAFELSSAGVRRRLLALTWFAEAVMLWDACRREDIRHIYAQLDGTAPMVAMLAVELENARGARSERWQWSHRMHGSKEFYEIHPERLAARAASASFIACISDYTRSQAMAFVPEELWDKLLVIRCGVDLDEFAASSREPDAVPRILTVGRIDAMKGTVLLLQALAELARRGLRPELTVVGDGPSKEKSIRMAESLGVAEQVTWGGAVGQDRIRDYYEAADIFCLPSFAEGIPIVLMEAMAMEVPVVTNAITGIVELVENGVSGLLVRPGRLDQLTDALAQLLTDHALRRSMGEAGRRRVAAEYDLGQNVRGLAEVFMSGPPRAMDVGRPVPAVDVAVGKRS
jgi:colanic acid/amylovoran biosynthesis glycosyltransferase